MLYYGRPEDVAKAIKNEIELLTALFNRDEKPRRVHQEEDRAVEQVPSAGGEVAAWGVPGRGGEYLRGHPVAMIDLLIAGVVGILAALGGLFIKDLKALAIFTVLISLAAFLLSFLMKMPAVSLGLLGLSVAAVKIGRAGKRAVERRIRTYRSRRRLTKLEEAVRTLPENIIDVIPAGAVRAVHPKIVGLVSLINDAYSKGYTVDEPSWFRTVRQYLAAVGPQYTADRTKVVSEYEIAELEF